MITSSNSAISNPSSNNKRLSRDRLFRTSHQPRPQGLLGFQNGGGFENREDPGDEVGRHMSR